jgi:membrane fusion protein, copper/silver efflux system
MNARRIVIPLGLVLAAGLAGAALYWSAIPVTDHSSHAPAAIGGATVSERVVLYYRDPSGAPVWSAEPRKDHHGRDFLPVYDDQEPSFDLPAAPVAKPQAAKGERKILYYRNPMGLADTSPTPKKDSMGMDYIPVYEGEDDDGNTVKLSLGKIQRSGVRTEPAEKRLMIRQVRAVGTVAYDERRLTIVTLRSDGYIEDLFVNTTGQPVRAGEPLFRVYSAQIQQAQTDLIVAVRAVKRGMVGSEGDRALEGAMQRLRNLAVPEARIHDVHENGVNPRTIDWPAPANGTVIVKRVINGQRVVAGDELYRIADTSTIWVIADVAEADLAMIRQGTRAVVTFRAYPMQPVEGEVTLIYPEVKPETRTARVRIEVANPDGRLKADMYADVVFRTGDDHSPVVTVPHDAVINSGTQQVVFVARGEGRFEPRKVKVGRRSDGYCEVLEGLREGEEVVTSATFLIDSESNLRAALKSFGQESAR